MPKESFYGALFCISLRCRAICEHLTSLQADYDKKRIERVQTAAQQVHRVLHVLDEARRHIDSNDCDIGELVESLKRLQDGNSVQRKAYETISHVVTIADYRMRKIEQLDDYVRRQDLPNLQELINFYTDIEDSCKSEYFDIPDSLPSARAMFRRRR